MMQDPVIAMVVGGIIGTVVSCSTMAYLMLRDKGEEMR